MRTIENQITTARHSLGARLVHNLDESRHCTLCGNEVPWLHLNIDGIFFYLCTRCWVRLTEFVADPLR